MGGVWPDTRLSLQPPSRRATDEESSGATALGVRPPDASLSLPTTPDKQTAWPRAFPLPTVEEKQWHQSCSVQTNVVPINVSGRPAGPGAGEGDYRVVGGRARAASPCPRRPRAGDRGQQHHARVRHSLPPLLPSATLSIRPTSHAAIRSLVAATLPHQPVLLSPWLAPRSVCPSVHLSVPGGGCSAQQRGAARHLHTSHRSPCPRCVPAASPCIPSPSQHLRVPTSCHHHPRCSSIPTVGLTVLLHTPPAAHQRARGHPRPRRWHGAVSAACLFWLQGSTLLGTRVLVTPCLTQRPR